MRYFQQKKKKRKRERNTVKECGLNKPKLLLECGLNKPKLLLLCRLALFIYREICFFLNDLLHPHKTF